MPSFDVVSEIEMHELNNALDQANREVGTRFDFKGSDSSYKFADNMITLDTGSEMQCQQMVDILYLKAGKRGIELTCFDPAEPQTSGKRTIQKIALKQGINKELGKKMVKIIKDSKLKVQSQIQGEQVRVTGKKRDDLQSVMELLKSSKLGVPLQFTNFRD